MDAWVGIDGGNNGGIVVIDRRFHLIDQMIMPTLNLGKGKRNKIVYDEIAVSSALRDWVSTLTIRGVVLEKAQAMPKQGLSSTFKTGHDFGFIKGVLVALQVPYAVVRSQDWMKAELQGIPGDGKQRSILRAQRMFPTLDLTPGRKRTPHDGLADAANMAKYAMSIWPMQRAKKVPPARPRRA